MLSRDPKFPSIWNKLLSGYQGCRESGEKRLPIERETEAPDSKGRGRVLQGQVDVVHPLCSVMGSSSPLGELKGKSTC